MDGGQGGSGEAAQDRRQMTEQGSKCTGSRNVVKKITGDINTQDSVVDTIRMTAEALLSAGMCEAGQIFTPGLNHCPQDRPQKAKT